MNAKLSFFGIRQEHCTYIHVHQVHKTQIYHLINFTKENSSELSHYFKGFPSCRRKLAGQSIKVCSSLYLDNQDCYTFLVLFGQFLSAVMETF